MSLADEELLDTAEFTSAPKVSVPVEYNARDLIIYSLGIGSSDPRFVYELHPDFAAFPTYPIALTYKGTSFDVLPFPPPAMMAFPLPRLPGTQLWLDGEKLIEKVCELPKDGSKLQLVGGVTAVQQKGRGAVIERVLDLVDERGKVYYKIVDASFWVGARGFKDSGKNYSQIVQPPKGVPPFVRLEVEINEHIASLYRLSGDYNPLHVDPQISGAVGFAKPIIHGNCTLGYTTRVLLDALADGNQKRFRSVQMRYASPVLPGERLMVEVWKASPTEFIFQLKSKVTGKVCCSNGLLKLNPEGSL